MKDTSNVSFGIAYIKSTFILLKPISFINFIFSFISSLLLSLSSIFKLFLLIDSNPRLNLFIPYFLYNNNFSFVVDEKFPSIVYSILFDLFNLFIILNNLSNCFIFKEEGVPPPI